jgi:arsenate reductase-like glutaredoxin family protein
MLSTPSIIKRPVLEHEGVLRVGFREADYEALFG